MGELVVSNKSQEAGKELASREEATRENERYAIPPVDIYETHEGLVVLADLPGVKPEGLSISVEDGTLTIEGKYSKVAAVEYIEREFDLSSFYRQFRINEAIDTEKIKAVLKNGVLNLTLPKSEKAKPRQIPVET